MQYEVEFDYGTHTEHEYIDAERLADLHAMFSDKNIDGIWCVRGGYGVSRILDMLNYKVIRENPKVLVGYSDITALHQAIFRKTGLVCFHGPGGASDFTPYTTKHVQNVLMNPTPKYTIEHLEEHETKES
ncbi:LD-carboxypeptidase, partial [uncultured Paraglaciecola sp.]|uniref:LD-carboxypeptidase n=1 Tax=uncultured Paraglaciecola sp. TaxID=1765024 RepID=UPI0026260E40